MLVAGLLLLTRAPTGALRTAGSVATVTAVPPLLFFVTFDHGTFPPYSTEAILGVSAAAWIGLHFAGPAAGRPFPLGAGLVAAWLFVLQIVEQPFTAPFDFVRLFTFELSTEAGDLGGDGRFPGDESFTSLDPFGDGFAFPDTTTMAAISLLAGALLVVGGHRLDRAGHRGRATAVAAAALPMLAAGPLLLTEELEPAGSGVVLALVGLALGADAATRGRRLSTWAGAIFAVVGVGMVANEVGGDSTAAFGLSALVAGVGIVAAAHFGARAVGEPDELDPVPSTYRRPSAVPGPPPPPPPDWSPPTSPPTAP